MPSKLHEAIPINSIFTADSYFRAISDSVGSWNVNQTFIILIISLFGLIGLLITLSFIYQNFFKTQSNPKDEFSTTKASEILEILTTALDQRSKLEMAFSHESPQKTAFCSLNDIQKNSLILEFPPYLNPTNQWVGKEVICYFKIIGKTQIIFYHFKSKILEIDRSEPNIVKGILTLPERLNLQQKRNHYRLEVPPGFVQKLLVWKARYTQKHALSTKVSSWGEALFSIDPQSSAPIELQDISGGGLRLKIPRTTIKNSEFDQESDKNFFIQIDLWDPEEQKTNTYWLFARARNIFEDYTSKDLQIGLQFVGQGKPQTDDPQNLTWKKVDLEEGVEEITTWVFRRHVEIHRKEKEKLDKL